MNIQRAFAPTTIRLESENELQKLKSILNSYVIECCHNRYSVFSKKTYTEEMNFALHILNCLK